MALRGPRPALLLLVVLLAAGLALGQNGPPWVELNKIFNKHHVNFPRTSAPNLRAYCNRMMLASGIYGTLVNTFVHAPIRSINNVCFRGGLPAGSGQSISVRSFSVTTCRYSAVNRSYSGTQTIQKIIIGCWNGLPVYYRQ